MKTRESRMLVVLGLLILGVPILSWAAASTAGGGVWIATPGAPGVPGAVDMQISFNVKDAGESWQDSGKTSIRVFDQGSGKLLALLHATDVWDVQIDGSEVWWWAEFRVTGLAFDTFGPIRLGAVDGGSLDQFRIVFQTYNVLKGNLFVHGS